MNKGFKKIIACILALTMVFSTSVITYASPMSIENAGSIYDMEQFLHKNEDGTVQLDTYGARLAGYSAETIAAVQTISQV